MTSLDPQHDSRLALARGLALLGFVAALLARAIEPALPGVWVGTDRYITAVKLGAAAGSQLLAVGLSLLMWNAAAAIARAPRPPLLRAFSLGIVLLMLLAVASASYVVLPDATALIPAVAAAAYALTTAIGRAPLHHTRAAALSIGAAGAGALLRVVAIGLVLIWGVGGTPELAARAIATLALAAEAVMLALALAWVVSRRRGGPAYPLLGAILVAAGGVVVVAVRGVGPEAHGASVLIGRALRELLPSPAPFAPLAVQATLEALAWLLMASLLTVRGRRRPVAVVLALGLLARTQLEVPLGALALVAAAMLTQLDPGPPLPEVRSTREGEGPAR